MRKEKFFISLIISVSLTLLVALPLVSSCATKLATPGGTYENPDYSWLPRVKGVDYTNHSSEKIFLVVGLIGSWFILFGISSTIVNALPDKGYSGNGYSSSSYETSSNNGYSSSSYETSSNNSNGGYQGSSSSSESRCLMSNPCSDCWHTANGKCAECFGTGHNQDLIGLAVESVTGEPEDCWKCNGTGECQTCGGSGEIDD